MPLLPQARKSSRRFRLSADGGISGVGARAPHAKSDSPTYKRVEESAPAVVKKDGRREPFDRAKIIAGLKRACEKRPVSMETIEQIASNIETTFSEQGDREVNSSAIGAAVMTELHKIDQVAYVRFASVYRSFKDIDEFMHELEDLINQRKQAPAAPRAGDKKGDSAS